MWTGIGALLFLITLWAFLLWAAKKRGHDWLFWVIAFAPSIIMLVADF